MQTTSFYPHGDGYAVQFDRSTFESLRIEPGQPVQIIQHNGVITLAPTESKAARFEEIQARILNQYQDAFRQLAE